MRPAVAGYYFRECPCKKKAKIKLRFLLRYGWTSDDFSFCARRNGKHYLLYYCDLCIVMATATHFLHDEFGS